MSDSQALRSAVPDTLSRSPLEGISGVWRFVRQTGGYRKARSLPGHLMHLVLTGSYKLRTNEREYLIRSGDVIYYHETEEVEWLGNVEEVTFYSVSFLAPELPPLPAEARVFASTPAIRQAFDRLYSASLLPRGLIRALRLHGHLTELILQVDAWRTVAANRRALGGESWWEIEALVRERKLFRPTLDELCSLTHRSRASVVRACRAATGTSPMKRVREIRMAEARGLLRFSHLNVSQVASYLGYPRVHEFSREFSRHFGTPPSAHRRSAQASSFKT